MAVPKQRKTKSRRDQRRMHIFLKEQALSTCSHCGRLKVSHTICKSCGYYKNKQVLNILGKLEKKERKKREKEIKQTEKTEAKKEKPLSLEELSQKKF